MISSIWPQWRSAIGSRRQGVLKRVDKQLMHSATGFLIRASTSLLHEGNKKVLALKGLPKAVSLFGGYGLQALVAYPPQNLQRHSVTFCLRHFLSVANGGVSHLDSREKGSTGRKQVCSCSMMRHTGVSQLLCPVSRYTGPLRSQSTEGFADVLY